MNQLRLFGDAFGEGDDGRALRTFLGTAQAAGVRCSLALAGIAPRAAAGELQSLDLDDGWGSVTTATALPPAVCAELQRCVADEVAATAPVVVFAPPGPGSDARLLASLAYPSACAVLVAGDGQDPRELLDRVRAEWRWAGVDRQPHAQPERALRAWLALPLPTAAAATIVHLASPRSADGTDLVLTAWRRLGGPADLRLRLVVAAGDLPAVQALVGDTGRVEIVAGPLVPEQLGDAIGCLQPWRAAPPVADMVAVLASARAVVASRPGELGEVLGGAATARPIGGTNTADGGFAPDPDAVFAGLVWLRERSGEVFATGVRQQRRVLAELVAGRCAPPPPPVREVASSAPIVVVAAPWFATDAAAVPAIALARELLARANVEVRLVLAGPAGGSVAALRARAPELLERLTRHPGAAHLWVACGVEPAATARPIPWLAVPSTVVPSAELVERQAFAAKFGLGVPTTVAADSAVPALGAEPLFELPLAGRPVSTDTPLVR